MKQVCIFKTAIFLLFAFMLLEDSTVVNTISLDNNKNIISIKEINDDEVNLLKENSKDFFLFTYKSKIGLKNIDETSVKTDFKTDSSQSLLSNQHLKITNSLNGFLKLLFNSKIVEVKQIYSVNLLNNPQIKNYLITVEDSSSSIRNNKDKDNYEEMTFDDKLNFYYYNNKKYQKYTKSINDLNILEDWIINKYLIEERKGIKEYIKIQSEMDYYSKYKNKDVETSLDEEVKCKDDALKIIENSVEQLSSNIESLLSEAKSVLEETNRRIIKEELNSSFNQIRNMRYVKPVYLLFIFFLVIILIALVFVLKRIRKSSVGNSKNNIKKGEFEMKLSIT